MPSPTISGAIQTANDASEALKAINLRAIKILVRCTKPSDDGLILSRKGARLLTSLLDGSFSFDLFCSATHGDSCPVIVTLNLVAPERADGAG